jgi:predicted O-methyltransferase YrrM
MITQNIRYTGCDFEFVADRHRREIRDAGIEDSNLRFVTNSQGTYAWPLFEMMQRGEQFDVIYLDGHHTFYVDLPAFVLADQLLKPGGYLLADDIEWTLNFVRDHMRRSMGAWYFYGSMYDFSQYSPQQRAMPHMKMIAQDLLVRRLGYEKIDQWSKPGWWTLRKPENPARAG